MRGLNPSEQEFKKMSKDAEYDSQVRSLREAHRLRESMLDMQSENFTVGELAQIFQQPHFSTAHKDLEALLKIFSEKCNLLK